MSIFFHFALFSNIHFSISVKLNKQNQMGMAYPGMNFDPNSQALSYSKYHNTECISCPFHQFFPQFFPHKFLCAWQLLA